jgi:hypothetical protein
VQPANTQEFLQAAAKSEQEHIATEISNAQIKVVSATFDRSVAYTNLMLVGGYAGFFGLWQLTKQFLSKQQALWAALLVLVSLVSFILFEVIKMIVISRSVHQQAAILRSPETRRDPQLLIQRLNEFEQIQQLSSARFMRIWAATVAVALGSALVGAGVLGYAFVCGLLK